MPVVSRAVVPGLALVATETAAAGCGGTDSVEQCMPPGTGFDVQYEQAAAGGTVTVTMTERPSLATDRIRVTVGETVAYDGGDIHEAYAASNASDGWGEEAMEGEQLVLSTDGPLPGYRTLSVEVRSTCDSWDQRVRSETPPPPMTISATAAWIDGRTYVTIPHESGIDFSATNIEVLFPGVRGVQGYVRGSITEDADGPDVLNEWSDDVTPGDRLRVATPESNPVDGVVSVAWYGHPDDERREIDISLTASDDLQSLDEDVQVVHSVTTTSTSMRSCSGPLSKSFLLWVTNLPPAS